MFPASLSIKSLPGTETLLNVAPFIPEYKCFPDDCKTELTGGTEYQFPVRTLFYARKIN